jgi:hypothetical protein
MVNAIDRLARAGPVPKAVVRMLFAILLGADPMAGATKEKSLSPDLTESLGFTKPLAKSELHLLPGQFQTLLHTPRTRERTALILPNLIC